MSYIRLCHPQAGYLSFSSMKHYAVYIILLLTLVGCIKEPMQNNNFRERLVVDGYIEQDSRAVVMLSTNTEYNSDYNEETFKDMIVRWAKVTLTDENNEEDVLIGRADDDYPTRYIYTSDLLEGRVGGIYTITIEYSNQIWTAETTILAPMTLSDIEVVDVGNDKYSIEATIPPSTHYCSIDCAINGSDYYAPTILGTYAPSDSPRRITINHPYNRLGNEKYSSLFNGNEVVSIRINTLSDFTFNYLRKWEDNFINSINPVFPSTSNLPTNISNNGIGIWAGYGTTYYRLGLLSEYNTK